MFEGRLLCPVLYGCCSLVSSCFMRELVSKLFKLLLSMVSYGVS
jgi:hypothetical protein